MELCGDGGLPDAVLIEWLCYIIFHRPGSHNYYDPCYATPLISPLYVYFHRKFYIELSPVILP